MACRCGDDCRTRWIGAATSPSSPLTRRSTQHRGWVRRVSRNRKGTDFSVFSKYAQRVELCLFDDVGNERRIGLLKTDANANIWHGHVRGAVAGQRYGYRVDGEYKPSSGHRFNPNKLLLDPYAKAIEGPLHWDNAVYGFIQNKESLPDIVNSTPYVPRSVVVNEEFDWDNDHQLNIPWTETVIYDLHVRGFTKQHPDIHPFQQGTYAALGSTQVIGHLKDLGVTALLLMSVHHHISERKLVERGLTNYWGTCLSAISPPRQACRRPGQLASRSGSSRKWSAACIRRG